MKKHEIKVGGLYTARVSGRFVTVRVDGILDQTGWNSKAYTTYVVTNLTTGRKTTFRSAAKFRCIAVAKPDGKGVYSGIDVRPVPFADGATETPPQDGTTAATEEAGKSTVPFVQSAGHAEAETTEAALTACVDAPATASPLPTIPSMPSSENTQASLKTGTTVTPPSYQHATVQSVGLATMSIKATMHEQTDMTEGTFNFSPIAGLAAMIAEQAEPAATGLTPQQQDILDTARRIEAARGDGQRVLVIKAGAGTGKTYTLKQLEQVLRGNGQYTAFNAKLVADSKPKFKRAACNTTHSLAFRAEGHKYKHRLGGARVRSWEVAQRLGINDYIVNLPEAVAPYEADGKPQTRRLKAAFLAGQVSEAIKRFCQSADREIGLRHIKRFDGLDEAGKYVKSDEVKGYLLPFAQRMWADLVDPVGTMPFSHDVYVKTWELNKPVIAADYIMLDEYQDTAPVMVSILQQQTHALVIMVGDDNQRIYEWRGAVNAGDHFPGATSRLLSQSFRFGQTVADVANAVLSTLEEPTDLLMQGLESIPTRVCEVENPRCYLYRTNAGAIARLMAGMDEKKRGHLVGNTDDIVGFCRAAKDLQLGKGTTHHELGCFEKWSEVEEYVKEDEGSDLRLMVKLIKDFTADRIIRAMADMPAEKDADFVVCTAHRSKGCEWPSVRLGQDFRTADKLDDAERRLVYVAATRAQEELDITQCPTFCGGYAKNSGGGEDGAPAEWIPGLEIKYTVPMPTKEQLAAYRVAKSTHKADEVAIINGKPYLQENKTAPTLRDADGNTWAKGKNGDWLVRGKPGQQGSITVTTRDGRKQTVTVKRVVWQDASAALYEV